MNKALRTASLSNSHFKMVFSTALQTSMNNPFIMEGKNGNVVMMIDSDTVESLFALKTMTNLLTRSPTKRDGTVSALFEL